MAECAGSQARSREQLRKTPAAPGRLGSAVAGRPHRSSTGKPKNPLTVVVAMLANLTIAVAKFAVAVLSGSAAMFAEGVHSVVDTLNQGILLYGARKSHQMADTVHPFGYGKEVYFWTLIYSVLLFGIGGGVSVYKGINELLHPEQPRQLYWNYVVLGVAFIAECGSWLVAVRAMSREATGRSFLQKLRRTTDPTRFVIFGEDSAAMLGVVVAFVGIFLAGKMNSSIPDALASIAIGVILCAAAVGLTAKTKDLLVGQAAAPDIVAETQNILQRRDDVLQVGPPLTMHLGPHQMLAAIDVKFEAKLTALEVARAVDEMECAIRKRFPQFTHIYIEAQVANRDIDLEQPNGGTSD